VPPLRRGLAGTLRELCKVGGRARLVRLNLQGPLHPHGKGWGLGSNQLRLPHVVDGSGREGRLVRRHSRSFECALSSGKLVRDRRSYGARKHVLGPGTNHFRENWGSGAKDEGGAFGLVDFRLCGIILVWRRDESCFVNDGGLGSHRILKPDKLPIGLESIRDPITRPRSNRVRNKGTPQLLREGVLRVDPVGQGMLRTSNQGREEVARRSRTAVIEGELTGLGCCVARHPGKVKGQREGSSAVSQVRTKVVFFEKSKRRKEGRLIHSEDGLWLLRET